MWFPAAEALNAQEEMTGIARLCKLFGKTRQAWYERQRHFERRRTEELLVLGEVKAIRRLLPKTGLQKLYSMLKPFLKEHEIKMGRDALWGLLRREGLMQRTRGRTGPRTTNSWHRFRKWPNLVEGLVPLRPEMVVVSDITYIRGPDGTFFYLALITDAYSKRILGYCLSRTLEAKWAIKALRMALRNRSYTDEPMIHHSDRGIQYCSNEYVKLLQDNEIRISMTQSGDPTENPIAERINGILKQELDLDRIFPSFDAAQRAVNRAVYKYNELRPHASCDLLVPAEAHQQTGELKKHWRAKKLKVKNSRVGALAAPDTPGRFVYSG